MQFAATHFTCYFQIIVSFEVSLVLFIMTVASTCFKWVDLLESQFDKSWIELDSLLLQLEDDEDFAVLYNKSRRQASSLASCFSQLSHKATVVFQNNAKLEAELVHLREELASTKATIERINREKVYLSSALQSSLAKNHKLQYLTEQVKNEENVEEGETVENAEPAEEVVTEAVSDNINLDRERDLEIYSLLLTENKRLRADVIELESEMVGARLDNVYLDKELAGRIQQVRADNSCISDNDLLLISSDSATARQQHAQRHQGEDVDTDRVGDGSPEE